LSPLRPVAIKSAYVGIWPAATYLSIRSGRIPSEAKKIAFEVSGASAGAGAAPDAEATATLPRPSSAVAATTIGLRLMSNPSPCRALAKKHPRPDTTTVEGATEPGSNCLCVGIRRIFPDFLTQGPEAAVRRRSSAVDSLERHDRVTVGCDGEVVQDV